MATTPSPADVQLPAGRSDGKRSCPDVESDPSEADAQELITQVLLTGLALAPLRANRTTSEAVRRLRVELDRTIHDLQHTVWNGDGDHGEAFDRLALLHQSARSLLAAELAAAQESETRAPSEPSTLPSHLQVDLP